MDETIVRCQDQAQLFINMNSYAENGKFDQFYSKFAELAENSEHMCQIMLNTSELTQRRLDLTEEILKLLETMSINMKIVRYKDWIDELIDMLKLKLNNDNGIGGSDTWNQINHTLSKKLKGNKGKKIDFNEREQKSIKRLGEILKEVGMAMEEFETLMSLKFECNKPQVDMAMEEFETLMSLKFECNKPQVHKESQTRDDGNSQLETLPEDIQGLFRKVFKALEIWETQL